MNQIHTLEEFLYKANDVIHNSSIKRSKKSVIAGSLLAIAFDHAMSFVILIKNQQYNSASALMRTIYENLIRAIWISECSTAEEIDLFIEHDKFLENRKNRNDEFIEYKLAKLAEIVGEKLSSNIFDVIYKKYWNIFCSFTHSGLQSITRNITQNTIEISYSDEEIFEIVRLVFCFSLLLLGQFSEIGDKEEECNKIVDEYLPAAGLTFLCLSKEN